MRHNVWAMRCFRVGFIFVVLGIVTAANATIVSYDMTLVWNQASPAGAAPWLTASFDDENTLGDVVLTITGGNLVEGEKVGILYFNLDPSLTRADLTFLSGPTLVSGEFSDPTASIKGLTEFDEDYRADGDGYFDIKVEFVITDGAPVTFAAGDAVEYTIGGIPSLSANSFNFMSDQDGGEGMYIIVAHIQGIGDGGEESGWVATPEPATILLLTLGGLILRRPKKNS